MMVLDFILYSSDSKTQSFIIKLNSLNSKTIPCKTKGKSLILNLQEPLSQILSFRTKKYLLKT